MRNEDVKPDAIIAQKRRKGSIAQLVQSVCLTSRGSGVRLPLLPPKKTVTSVTVFFIFPLPVLSSERESYAEFEIEVKRLFFVYVFNKAAVVKEIADSWFNVKSCKIGKPDLGSG